MLNRSSQLTVRSSFVRSQYPRSPRKILPEDTLFDPNNFIQPGLTKQDIIDLKEVFDDFDLSQSGFISPLELRAAMSRFGIDVKKKVIFEILAQFDEEEIGELDFRCFLKIATSTKVQDSRREVIKTFNNYDRDKKGYVSKEDIKKMAVRHGEEMTEDDLQRIMDDFGSEIEGVEGRNLTKDDFFKAMGLN